MLLRTVICSVLVFSVTAFARGNSASPTTGQGIYYDAATNKYFTDGQPTFSIQPLGNAKYLESIDVSVDNGSFKPYTGKLSFQTQGLHTIRFRAVDPVLNWSPVQVFRLYVDLTPPTSKISWKGPSYLRDHELYVTPKTKMTIAAEDNLSGAKVTYIQIGNSPKQIYNGPISFTHDGTVNVKVSSVDRVGNKEPWRKITFVVDSQPPVTTAKIEGVHYKSGSTYYVNYGSQIALASHDGGVGLDKIEYQINKGGVLTYTGPIALDQKYVHLKYRGVDYLGNTEQWKTLSLVQDSQPPVLNVTEMGKYIHVGGKTFAKPGYVIHVVAQDRDSGVKSVQYSTDNVHFKPLTGNEIVVPSTGRFTYNIRAVDNVGNVAEANPITVVMDNTPPTTNAQFAEKVVKKGSLILTSLPNELSLVSSDSGSGVDHVEYSYDGTHFKYLKGSIDLATWRHSLRTVYYRAVDRLGNVEPTQKLNVQVLTHGPRVGLFVESGNSPRVPLSAIIARQNSQKPNRYHRRARRHVASVPKKHGG